MAKQGKKKQAPGKELEAEPEQQPGAEQEPEQGKKQLLKPIKKGKVKQVLKSKKAIEDEEKERERAATAEAKASQDEENEVPVEGQDRESGKLGELYRSVWMEVPEGFELSENIVKRVMASVGPIDEVKMLGPRKAQCTFVSIGKVRQAMLLHNKPLAQLPFLKNISGSKDAPTPRTAGTPPAAFSASSSSDRLSVDLPLDPEYRVFVNSIPRECDNRELLRTLSHYGAVAYVYRNAHKSYGFAGFSKVSSVKKCLEAEVVMMRGQVVSIEQYKPSDTDQRRWQESRTSAAIQYLNSLVPMNPYVLQAPASASPAAKKSTNPPAHSPFSLTPMPPPSLGTPKKSPKKAGKRKAEAVEETLTPVPKKAKKAQKPAKPEAEAESTPKTTSEQKEKKKSTKKVKAKAKAKA